MSGEHEFKDNFAAAMQVRRATLRPRVARDQWASLATLDHLDQLAELDLVDRVVLLVGDLPTLNRHVTMIRTSSKKYGDVLNIRTKHAFVHSIDSIIFLCKLRVLHITAQKRTNTSYF